MQTQHDAIHPDRTATIVDWPADPGTQAGSGKALGLFLKRLLDIVVSLLVLVALSPVLFLVAVAVRFSSPGPILYRQERIGRNGVPFTILKFRTMQANNDATQHREFVEAMLLDPTASPEVDGTFKLQDARVTPVGTHLRRYSLDELPQLWNVIRGDMSLVGPRPSLSWEWELYDQVQRERDQVLPGCTGLWQVSGRNLLSPAEMLELDVSYVRNWSFFADLAILVKTPLALLRGDGAR